MSIVHYSHTNIKGTSCSHAVGPVTLFTGRNRSSKTAKMLGIELATTGSCTVGARADKLRAIVSKGHDSASAQASTDCISRWAIDPKGAHNRRQDQFGHLLRDKDFWSLTGEEKWKTISSLVPANATEAAMKRLKELSAGTEADGPALAESVQAHLANKKNACMADIENLSASLQPPEPYTGEPLSELNAKRRAIESLIADQKKAREYWGKRPDFDAEIATKQVACDAKTEEYSSLLERMSTLQKTRSKASALVDSLTTTLAGESKVMQLCREESPQACIVDEIDSIFNRFLEVAEVYQKLLPVEGVSLKTMASEAKAILGHVETSLAQHTEPLGMPSEVAAIHSLLTEDCNLCIGATSVHDALEAVNVLDNLMVRTGKSITSTAAEAAALVKEIERLKAQSQEPPQFDKPMSMEELTAKATELDAINKQVLRAQEWPAFEQRQKDVTQKIAELKAESQRLTAQLEEVRQIRADILQASTGPIQDEANRILTEMGIPTLKIKVESKGRFSSLTVEDSQGIDLSAMCGAENVLYGYALLCAIHQVSTVPCPVRLIEGAEMDADTLTSFLRCLVKMNYRGNTFIATHVKPLEAVEGVTVIEC